MIGYFRDSSIELPQPIRASTPLNDLCISQTTGYSSPVLLQHEYFYLGDTLGGFRKRGYEDYTHSQDFAWGIEELKKIATQFVTAFMCAERFPWRYHRRFIAKNLEEDGWRVIHILDKERTWEPKKSKIPPEAGLKIPAKREK
ncbi:MAG: DUF488 family protein [candidate division Zixibacteria bacterium]|nr:DUF488 family protein [candidate division Zixibacteria bacterium]